MLESTAHQPKILRKMVIRFGILSFVLIGAFFGYRYYAEWSKDIDLPETAETAGWVGAMRMTEEGAQIVVVKPNGSVVDCPGYTEGKYDKEFEWRPDGNRIFFLSDRVEGETNVFRWNFGAGKVARRTSNSRAKANIAFLPPSNVNANKTALLVSGKSVVEFNPVDGATWNVLPPIDKERTTTEDAVGSQTQMAYDQIGTSFKAAQWTPDKAFVVATMRNDDGEVLIIQAMGSGLPPMAIAKGRTIEFDVHPTDGRVFYMVTQYVPLEIPEEYVKDGVLKLPFQHMIGWFDPTKMRGKDTPPDAGGYVAQLNNPGESFKSMSLSPDGSKLAFVATKQSPDGVDEPGALVVMPAQNAGATGASIILKRAVMEPSWLPNGAGFLFILREGGERAIFKIDADGTGLKNLTKGKGNFAYPKMSPQIQ